MENPPPGTQIADPNARRPRAPRLNLSAHDLAVREAENAPQVRLFEGGGHPCAERNKAVLEHLTPEESAGFRKSLDYLESLFRVARERYDFAQSHQPEPEPEAAAELAPPEPEETAPRTAEPEEITEPDPETSPPEPDPEPENGEEDSTDTAPIDEDAMNAAFAAALENQ